MTEEARRHTSMRDTMLAPAAGVAATVASSTALTAVVDGWSWFGYVLITSLLVAATGVTLRAVRVPTPLVGLGQLLVLLLLVTGSFTERGVLAVLPGPRAVGELDAVLTAAFDQIRTALPPVEATPGILCLVTIALGLVAIVVDTLVVAAGAPAVAGLILLCVYAVPASLSDSLLSWPIFVCGAAAFAALLAVDGDHRHRAWRTRQVPRSTARGGAVATPVSMLGIAIVVGLVAGSAITSVGTVGRLPGGGGEDGDARAAAGGLGISPFTALRGMLNRDDETPLFRVRGLGTEQRLFRAFTLNRYQPNEGWGLPEGPIQRGVPARGGLPVPAGTNRNTQPREITIEPLNWNDVWLPVFGTPRELRNLDEGWRYNAANRTVFRERKTSPDNYVELADISQPDTETLRAAGTRASAVSARYTRLRAVDQRVTRLAERITSDATTRYDKARAVWEHFNPQNGFRYSTSTAPQSDPNALADFLFNGKRGYCEQYASAMAVMLRSLDIPARVAVGFTNGYRDGNERVITSRDAHAWVEVHFADVGWVNFDPTPLADGRGFVPSYLESETPDSSGSDTSDGQTSAEPSQQQRTPDQPTPEPGSGDVVEQAQTSTFPERAPGWAGWTGVAAALLAVALTLATVLVFRRGDRVRETATREERQLAVSRLARWLPIVCAGSWLAVLLLAGWQLHWAFAVALGLIGAIGVAPGLTREVSRRRRLHTIIRGDATAANAAWAELRDECADRGLTIAPGDTLRTTAHRVTHNTRLDTAGADAVRSVVGMMERRWYSPTATDEPTLPATFARLRHSLAKCAPVPLKAKLLPRSLLNRRRGQR